MFRLVLLLITGLFSLNLSAQQDMSIPLGNRMYDVFELTPTVTTQQLSVEVNSATSLTIDIHTALNSVNVMIVDPSGFPVPSSTINSFTVSSGQVPPLGAVLFAEGIHVQARINNPVAGTWLVNVSIPIASSVTTGTMTVIQTGALQVAAIISRPTYNIGDPVVIAIAAFDSGASVLGAVAQANIYQQGTELTPQTITLHDDGGMPDMLAGDGLYTGQINGLPVGDYLVETVLQHGSARAVAGAQFEVIPAIGMITDNVTDSGIDTNADGLFERIDVNFEIDIVMPGTYDLLAELKIGTKTILNGKQVVLTPGLGMQSISFSAEDIKKFLESDGPYEISDVRLIKIGNADGTQPTRMADKRTDLGMTQSYQLQQLQRPLTLVLEGLSESALDTDGNGKFDVLKASFQIDVLQQGSYNWSGSLKAQDGTTLVTASRKGYLGAAGLYNLSLDFKGKAIGTAGIDGPYTIADIGVYGPPNAATIRREVGQTAAYTASQFEGFLAPLPGDLNADGCVDRADYDILIADVRDGGDSDPAHDLNKDGNVNRADARTMVGLFSNPRGAVCEIF